MKSNLSLPLVKARIDQKNEYLIDIYNEIILLTATDFESFNEYSDIMHFLVSKFIYFDDYLHSNNLMQFYKLETYNNKQNFTDWYKYYEIKLYSKRSIKYYLDHPDVFWNIIHDLHNSDEFSKKVDVLLIDTIEFYKQTYIKYPDYLKNSIINFLNYEVFNKSNYIQSVQLHLTELAKLVKVENNDDLLDIYNALPSKRLFNDLFDTSKLNSFELENKEQKDIKTNNAFYSDLSLDEEDRNKRIMIIGDDPFTHNENVIYGIGKMYNIHKDQFDIYNDYEKITNKGSSLVNVTRYNDKYIGIICGSMPHSTNGNDGFSDLIARMKSEEGYPQVEVCKTNNDNKRLKITKQSFKEALNRILLNYKSK